MNQINVGDVITFRSPTRSGARKAVRPVVGVDPFGRPMVRYYGCRDFIVKPQEVLAVERKTP